MSTVFALALVVGLLVVLGLLFLAALMLVEVWGLARDLDQRM